MDVTKPTDPLISGHRSARLTNVTKPTLTVYAPNAKSNTGAAALVFPGGPNGANPGVYLKLSIFFSLILWWVVVELIWIAVIKLRTGKTEA